MARRGDTMHERGWPFVPGDEVAGTVREVGDGVTGLAAGQRVAAFMTQGGLAKVARARAALAVPLPDAVPFPLAAAAPAMLTTALLLLTDAARFTPGERVLVHSATGGVGSAVAQLVPVLGGGRLVGTVGRPDKVATALEAGYDAAFARTDDLPDAVRAATGGGADVVLDPLGATMVELRRRQVRRPGRRPVAAASAGPRVRTSRRRTTP
jgi:NADPH:quinone reductase